METTTTNATQVPDVESPSGDQEVTIAQMKQTESSNGFIFDINDKNCRIALWCIVYVIETSMLARNASIIVHTHDDDYWSSGWYDEDQITYYELSESTFSILGLAATILLCTLYCACCTCTWATPFASFLFIVGAIMRIAMVGYVVDLYTYTIDGASYNDIFGWFFFGQAAWMICFTVYLVVDVLRSVGDNIKTRICAIASVLLLRCICVMVFDFDFFFIWYGDELGQDALNSIVSNILISLCCIASLVIVCRSPTNPPKLWVKRVIAWLLIGCAGTSTAFYAGSAEFSTGWIDYLVGAVALAIDVQYM